MSRQSGWLSGVISGSAFVLVAVFVLMGNAPLGPMVVGDPGDEPTFYTDVLPILQANCQACHQSAEVKTGGMVAPMALETYEQTRPWAAVIAREVTEGRMPPWSAHVQHKGTFEDERYLTEAEKRILVTWAENGSPAGDPSRTAAVAAPAERPSSETTWMFGRPDLVVEFAKPVVIGDEVDDWQPTILAPVTREQHTEPRWIKSAEIQAGGPYVHHVVTSHLGVGTPGRGPFKFPEGWGVLLPTDPVVTFNMHYYKTPGPGTAIEDETRGGFQFYRPGEVIDYVVETDINSSGRDLLIPAGEANHEVTWARPFEEDSYLLSMGPHAHYRAKSFRYTLEYPDGKREELLWIPNYDFNWQHLYQFKDPKFIPAGSKLIATWTFDNSVNNPYNPDPTVDVPYGVETYNEMANARIYFASATPRNIVVGAPIPEDVRENAEAQEESRREQLRRTGVVLDHN